MATGLAGTIPVRNDSALGPPPAPGSSWGSEMIDPPPTAMPTAGASDTDSDSGSVARAISPSMTSNPGDDTDPSPGAPAPVGPLDPSAGMPGVPSPPCAMPAQHADAL